MSTERLVQLCVLADKLALTAKEVDDAVQSALDGKDESDVISMFFADEALPMVSAS